ncbi:hypothetical protein GCM10010357_32430 [Streptomyces luteireticuli]|uniref:Uncharacterized protein n=1 Tax=Streptomyces luteireticuli TaxID=173858 RepID=A0ABP3IKU1_9ACTN
MVPHHLGQGQARTVRAGGQLAERRALGHLGAQQQPGHRQQPRRPERHPPAPRAELLVRESGGESQGDAVGEEETRGRPELRHARPEHAAVCRGVLRGQQDRAAPLAAEPEPLEEAQRQQEHRGADADRGVGGDQADADGGDPGQQQGRDEDGPPAPAVAEVAEERRAQRPGDEPRAEGAEGREGAQHGRDGGEEERAEDQRRRGAVGEEVVELDGRPGEGCGRHTEHGRRAVMVHVPSNFPFPGGKRGAWR